MPSFLKARDVVGKTFTVVSFEEREYEWQNKKTQSVEMQVIDADGNEYRLSGTGNCLKNLKEFKGTLPADFTVVAGSNWVGLNAVE
jgi:hypothetical protein